MKKILNSFKDRQVFLIDAAHLLQRNTTLMDFSYALTDLGEVVLDEAARVCYEDLDGNRGQPLRSDGTPCAFAIFGLGKFGGREMGYASDFELLFVHDAAECSSFFEAFARQGRGFHRSPQPWNISYRHEAAALRGCRHLDHAL